MTGLVTLEARNNEIADLTPALSLTKLSYLLVSGNQISTVAPVKDIKVISEIDLANNPLGTSVAKTAVNCPSDATTNIYIREFCAATP
jgi:Leucine-rich repeat (LRR) protein